MVDWIDGAYQSQVLDGARDAARDRRVQLLCFAGGMLNSAHREGPQRNAIFELVGPENVDGLILMSGTIGNEIGSQGLVAYAERFGPIPRVSIAMELPGMSSVVVDNRTGIESAILHLCRSHGCRRIAFVRGPSQNLEAELRYRVYRDVLTAEGIALDPALVTDGDFLLDSGHRAVRTLYDERSVRPDAIVTANDQMAMGVLEALAARKVRVPADVVVVGFDDIAEARFTSPPLTTVRQPLYEQGREAVRLLLSEVYGSGKQEQVTLHTEFVARRSCRCFNEQSRIALPALPRRASFEAALVERRQVVLADLARGARGGLGMLGAGWEARLLGQLTDELRGSAPGAFVNGIEESALKVLEQHADFNLLHDVLGALRRHLLPCVEVDHERRAQAEELFQQARTSIGQISERAQAQQKLSAVRSASALAHTGGALLKSFRLQDLSAAIAESFPGLGIRSCFLALRTDSPATRDALALAYAEGRELGDLEAASARRGDLPRYLLDGGAAQAFYVATLCSDQQVLGYALLELAARDGLVYETVREFLSAAVRGIALHARTRRTDAPPAPG